MTLIEASGQLGRATELGPYQDEPAQMRSGAPGKSGKLRMGFERRGDRSVLVDLYRRAPLLVQKALYWDDALPSMPCVFMIHTSGSVLQGDRFDISVRLGVGALAHLTTQAATKIHEMDANYAAQDVEIELEDGAYLEYLPGVLIPHRHARYISHTRMTVHEGATLLAADILMPGRKYHGEGELFEYDVFSSTVSARRPDGTNLFTERILIEPGRQCVREVGVMGAFDVLANVLLLTPEKYVGPILDQVRPSLDAGLAAGASRLPNDAGIVFRVLGMETEPVQAKVREFWGIVRRTVVGAPVPPEFLWR